MPSFAVEVHHTSLSVADLDTQQEWYQRALGLTEIVERYELEDPELIERTGSTRQQPHADPLEASLAQGFGHWALSVTDLDQAFAELITAGGAAVWPPAPVVQPGARFAYVKDPEGNLIELIQLP